MEEGIPSACEYDTDAVLSQQALIAVSGKRPYMGNTCPVPVENGHLTTARFGTTPEQISILEAENPENLYMMQHSVAHRRLRNPDENAPYAIRNFAYDQGFGVTIRYDFTADKGQKITMCRFSPDGSKLFIGSGEIVMGGGYEGYNCSQAGLLPGEGSDGHLDQAVHGRQPLHHGLRRLCTGAEGSCPVSGHRASGG